MKVLVFGNPYLEYDSLAIEIAEELELEGVEFVKCNSPEQVMQEEFDYIMDVVEGIYEFQVFSDLKKLSPHRMFSLHDFDLTFFLGLMERLGKVDKVQIIGIPIDYDKEKAKEEVRQVLTGH